MTHGINYEIVQLQSSWWVEVINFMHPFVCGETPRRSRVITFSISIIIKVNSSTAMGLLALCVALFDARSLELISSVR